MPNKKVTNLVIVESPAKAKTIEKILGKEYQVLSSYGHVRDLNKKDLGIDLTNSFQPKYIISPDKKKVVDSLKKAADAADVVWLASDEDREGEAIAWHLYEVLKRKGKPTKRIVFHEITPTAIKHAIEHPRDIDTNLVYAQQARRVLDRIVGFEISPILWRRIKPSLSAGRVQSAALRLICDREEEAKNFVPQSSYKALAQLASVQESEYPFFAEATKPFDSIQEAKIFLEKNAASENKFVVTAIEGKEALRYPAPPFTTSTLQQEAARKLGFSVAFTMSLAQKLYESGSITYMRTDSTNLSTLALDAAAKVITKKWGKAFHTTRNYTTKSKGAQEAHEAIRPTYMEKEQIDGDAAMQKLYHLIRQRTLASQMVPAKFERTHVSIENKATGDLFHATGEVRLFDGFMVAYSMPDTDSDENDAKEGDKRLPHLNQGDELLLTMMRATEHYTYPPARFTEGSLVKKMEELGIGRPSTYASTINTLFNRDYIQRGTFAGSERIYHDLELMIEPRRRGEIKEKTRTEKTGSQKGKLIPTDIGVVVNKYLMEAFPQIVDYNFTADIEEEFDQIAEGALPWATSLDRFYKLFHPLVENALEDKNRDARGERLLGNDPKSGRKVIARIGRFGPLVQMGVGEDNDGEKPLFASLLPTQSIATITLEEALALLSLPRSLGVFQEKEVKANIGRFGPYVQWGSLFVSVPKEMNVYTMILDQAMQLLYQRYGDHLQEVEDKAKEEKQSKKRKTSTTSKAAKSPKSSSSTSKRKSSKSNAAKK